MDGLRKQLPALIKYPMHPRNISISDYTYTLPDERIAAHPLPERDDSKLLVYRDGNIREDIYRNLAAHLPENSLLVFNNTKVIQARILFQKASGGMIEIFCLEPYESLGDYAVIMSKKGSVRWKCMIGGASKWKEGPLVKEAVFDGEPIRIQARLTEKLPDAYVVELSWEPADYTFAEMLGLFGDMPLPPYIKRKTEAADRTRYQTIFARQEGSVAAPTAGLHFTGHIFSSLAERKIDHTYVTLHVGAGTFKPVKASSMEGHEMHSEWMDVELASIRALAGAAGNLITAVGTTSLRTLESLYWMGVKLHLQPALDKEKLPVGQWEPYETPLSQTELSRAEALEALLNWMERQQMQRLIIPTQILIAPGYRYRMAGALITNFHQPQSTLLLLVAAAVGDDWKKIYRYALENDFRFLSYGDGSLLFLNEKGKTGRE